MTANSDLLQYFFEDVAETMQGIETRMEQLKAAEQREGDISGTVDEPMEALAVLAHRLRGTAGLYGFPQMSQLASVMERLLLSKPKLEGDFGEQFIALLGEIVSSLRGGMTHAQEKGTEGSLGLDFARSGAPERLSHLLRAQPLAFRLRRTHAQPLELDLLDAESERESHSSAAAVTETGDTLARQLQQFVSENGEVWEYFAPEVQEHLEALQIQLQSEAPDVNVMFRSAHTIKGSSYMVGLQPLGDFAHRLEDLLGAVRDGVQELDEPVIDTLEASTEMMSLMMTAAHQEGAGATETALEEPTERLRVRLQLLAGGADWAEVVARETQRAVERTQAEQSATDARAEAEQADSASNKVVSTLDRDLAAFGRDNGEVMEYFAPEVQEHIDLLRAGLETTADTGEADINALFRSAHTIKGSSYMVGLQPLGDFAHRLEDLFGVIRDGDLELSGPVLESSEAAVNVLGAMLDIAQTGSGSVAQDAEVLSERLRKLATGQTWAQIMAGEQVATSTAGSGAASVTVTPTLLPVRTSVRVDTRRLEGLMAQVGDVVVSRTRLAVALEQFAALQAALDDSQARFSRTVRDFEERYLNPDMVQTSTDTNAAVGVGADLSAQFDELEFDTYNDLNILARSMTELAADFSEVRSRFDAGLREVIEENEDLGKLTRQLRLDLSRVSRVPFSNTASRLRRWARERSERLNLTIYGETTEIDTAVLQQLAEPLLHLLNNAATHGISSPEVRASQGKPAKGEVQLFVQETGNFLEVTVQDDGQGLDLEKIRIRALERGLRSGQELEQMDEGDIARLVLLPGLSTADTVTSEAGRGVGMDVVASTLRQIGGDLLIRTEEGKGTAFTMRVPLNQRIADLLTAWVGEHQVAFAVGAIRVLLERPESDFARTENGNLEVELEGERIPVVDLRRIWGVDTEEEDSDWAVIAVLKSVAGDIAVRVSELGNITESAIGALGTVLAQMDYLSGTTVSPEGQPVAILDPAGLGRLARRREMWLRPRGAAERMQKRRVLLVDDSLSVRRLVSRMLDRGGYEVVTANDGQEAADLLQLDSNFSLVISDLEMPRMNGYELLSFIRGRAATAELPLVVMTTRAGEKHQRLAFELGANDYFSKPVDEALLLRRLSSMLSKEA